MAGLRTTAELLDDALDKAGEKTNGTSEYNAFALTQMNQRYKQILSGAAVFSVSLGEPWAWAKSRYPAILILEPVYETGSVALTQDSAAGTFSTAPAASQVGKLLKLADRPDVMRIASHTAATTAFTLDGAYADATITGSAFKAYKLDYELGASGGLTTGILRLFSPFRVHRPQASEADGTGTISQLDQPSFEEKWPLNSIEGGVPTEFCLTYAFDGLVSVRFNKSVAVKTRLEYDYIPVPAELTDVSTSVPLIPEAYRDILSLATAHDILLDKEDDKAQSFFQLTQASLVSMVTASRKDRQNTRRNFGRIIPRLDLTRTRRLWATED